MRLLALRASMGKVDEAHFEEQMAAIVTAIYSIFAQVVESVPAEAFVSDEAHAAFVSSDPDTYQALNMDGMTMILAAIDALGQKKAFTTT